MIVKNKLMTLNELRAKELEKLRKELKLKPSEVLQPKDVIKLAKNKRKYPTLYGYFMWDDEKASHEYRLLQARHLIVSVKFLPVEDSEPMQVFVSLKSDRVKEGGGYRRTVDVLSDEDMRKELLQQALDEIEYWENRYKQFRELKPIFNAVKNVRRRLKKVV